MSIVKSVKCERLNKRIPSIEVLVRFSEQPTLEHDASEPDGIMCDYYDVGIPGRCMLTDREKCTFYKWKEIRPTPQD